MIQLNNLQFNDLKSTKNLILQKQNSFNNQPGTGFDKVLSGSISDTIVTDKKRPDKTDNENTQNNKDTNQQKSDNNVNAQTQQKTQKTDTDNAKNSDNNKEKHKEDQTKKITNDKTVKEEKNTIKTTKHEIKKLTKEDFIEKKTESEEIPLMLSALLENMNKLITELKSNEKKLTDSDLKNILQDLKQMITNAQHGKEKVLLGRTLEKIKDFIENIQLKLAGTNQNIKQQHLPTIQKLINTLLKATKLKEQESHTGKSLTISTNDTNAISAKIDSLIKNIGDASQNKSEFSDNSGNQHNFSFLKAETGIKKIPAQMLNRQNIPDFKEQLHSIMDRARISVRDNRNATFSVKLYPKELGHININLGLEHGLLHGKFIVENQEARALLQNNLAFLREELAGAGINVGDFLVDVHDQRDTFLDDEQENFRSSSVPDSKNLTEQEYINQSHKETAYSHTGSIDMII